MRAARGLLVLLALTAACETASPLSAVTSLLRVEGAQRVEGAPPAGFGGPGVRGLSLLSAAVWPGQQGKPLGGTLDAGATAVSLYLTGDRSHFILPAAPPDVTAPELPTFATALSFAPELPPGPRALQVQATDEQGRYGAPLVQALSVAEEPSPPGALVFTLRWQRAADLDLHVEEPSGSEIWARRKGATSTPVGAPEASAGHLDADSNAQCVLDGRQRESVIYAGAVPAGRYRVRVDTFSLCGQATAYWQLEARAHGLVLATARGQSLPSSTRGPHGQGAGVLALEVELP
ncbi:MAG: hypothetical protein U1A78_21115 [Polyangia bacterium]